MKIQCKQTKTDKQKTEQAVKVREKKYELPQHNTLNECFIYYHRKVEKNYQKFQHIAKKNNPIKTKWRPEIRKQIKSIDFDGGLSKKKFAWLRQ